MNYILSNTFHIINQCLPLVDNKYICTDCKVSGDRATIRSRECVKKYIPIQWLPMGEQWSPNNIITLNKFN